MTTDVTKSRKQKVANIWANIGNYVEKFSRFVRHSTDARHLLKYNIKLELGNQYDFFRMDMDDVTIHQPGDAGNIQAIDKQSVHRICSGQVVLNLATAVKELVENSIDAGSNSIATPVYLDLNQYIRLREYGSELLEVVDNGCGVKEENFKGLTLKHHTSKLRDFSDLVSVDTFGFRGEALSSLCALSKLIVTTCYKDVTVGTKLEFDHNGKLLSQSPNARQSGTTVSLQSLFSTLPVRYKEFLRNIKKEFNKMVQVLYGYCIICTGVRINCTNQLGKGKKTVMVSTNGNNTIKENIANLFGAKQMQNILEFVQTDPSEDLLTEYRIATPAHRVFSITGYVSTCEHGHGRSSTDRQFYFINKRPCDLVKVSRVVNEVYHYYNRHQYPFVVLDISLDKESVDVNVTPDKRQIFIENEKLLLAVIKTSLMKLLEPKASLFQLNQAQTPEQNLLVSRPKLSLGESSQRSPSVTGKENISSSLASMKRSFSSAFAKSGNSSSTIDRESEKSKPNKQRKLDAFIMTPDSDKTTCKELDSHGDLLVLPSQSSPDTGIEISPQDTITSDILSTSQDTPISMTSSSDLNSPALPRYSVVFEDPLCFTRTPTQGTEFLQFDTEKCVPPETSTVAESNYNNSDLYVSKTTPSSDKENKDSPTYTQAIETKTLCGTPNSSEVCHLSQGSECSDVAEANCGKLECGSDFKVIDNSVWSHTQDLSEDHTPKYTVTVTEKDEPFDGRQKTERKVRFSMSQLKSRLQQKEHRAPLETEKWCRSFRAKINPCDNTAAEDELKREISKDMFLKMKILGQFNLGFIIGLLDRDLFIIDQHATDEKYNFEMLQRHTVIQSQKLIQPQTLELTAASEAILVDNLEIFHKNGFDFQINEEAEPTQRVKLVSMPVSKNWTFGKDDIDELLFMLSDSPGVHCRPSRVRMMFASRSCRKSVMIGTALDKPQMRKLIDHMAEIDQPWNCPHGRPTMRHLINLDMLPD